MRKRLSSRFVPAFRWVLLPLWMITYTGMILYEWPESRVMEVLLVGGWVLSLAGGIAIALTLKKVYLEKGRLAVHGFFGSTDIPVRSISEVSTFLAPYMMFVVVHVDPPCKFGTRFEFVPILLPPARISAIVAELRAIATVATKPKSRNT
jgi:hypothetical protein